MSTEANHRSSGWGWDGQRIPPLTESPLPFPSQHASYRNHCLYETAVPKLVSRLPHPALIILMFLFDNLKRIQLQRRGLSCGKVRRKHGDNDFTRMLRFNPWLKASIFIVFIIFVWGLMATGDIRGTLFELHRFRSLAAAALLFLLALVHFFVNHPRNFANNSRVLLIFGAILLHIGAIKVITPLLVATGWQGSGWQGLGLILVLPYALAPMLLTSLIDRNLGLFAAISTSFFGGLLMPLAAAFPYLFINLFTGFVAVMATSQLRQRRRFLRAGFYCGLAVMAGCLVFGFLDIVRGAEGEILGMEMLWRTGVPLIVGVGTGFMIAASLPLLERAFQATSNVSWVELADLNHPLLRRLSMEAPGTYHHSLMVANLAEAGAGAIGANVTMCRVGAYFHDIGKLNKPDYCIENIGAGSINPHDDLTPNMSAIVIMSHVKDGVDLALKHRLCDEIIDVIEQHHGTSLIVYFYCKALSKKEEMEGKAKAGEISIDDVPEVDEAGFRYPGPKPQSRETVIISLADSIESASRSLDKPTPTRIEQMVEELVGQRIEDGQLDDSDLSVQELAVLRRSFMKTLSSMLHPRISYRQGSKDAEDGGEATTTAQAARTRGDGAASKSKRGAGKKTRASTAAAGTV